MSEVAAHVIRGNTVESQHRMSAAVASPDGTLVRSWGDPNWISYLRSTAKPIQALAVVESGAADRFHLTSDELAIVASSHDGEEEHTRRVEAILARAGLDAGALQCGRHPPYNDAYAKRIGEAYSSLHHNCSGKHAGMLATCVHMGWDVRTYLQPDHPLQQLILRNVAHESGIDANRLATGTDGCGVPTFALPLANAARAFARLTGAEAIPGPRGASLRRIRDAMLAHPNLVAGTARLDTKIMTALPRRVWVKGGAEAFYAAGMLHGPYGIAVKIEDGASRAMGPVLGRLLEILGEDASGLADVCSEALKNHAGRVVGVIRPAF